MRELEDTSVTRLEYISGNTFYRLGRRSVMDERDEFLAAIDRLQVSGGTAREAGVLSTTDVSLAALRVSGRRDA